jgi:hypothetical protein
MPDWAGHLVKLLGQPLMEAMGPTIEGDLGHTTEAGLATVARLEGPTGAKRDFSRGNLIISIIDAL